VVKSRKKKIISNNILTFLPFNYSLKNLHLHYHQKYKQNTILSLKIHIEHLKYLRQLLEINTNNGILNREIQKVKLKVMKENRILALIDARHNVTFLNELNEEEKEKEKTIQISDNIKEFVNDEHEIVDKNLIVEKIEKIKKNYMIYLKMLI
jgi:hypothetical protein